MKLLKIILNFFNFKLISDEAVEKLISLLTPDIHDKIFRENADSARELLKDSKGVVLTNIQMLHLKLISLFTFIYFFYKLLFHVYMKDTFVFSIVVVYAIIATIISIITKWK
jgi:hypothetical protein